MEEYFSEGVPEYVETLFPSDFKGICVDVGAHTPMWINNTWIFEQKGWDAYCVEPNPHCIPLLRAKRKNVYEYALADKYEDSVTLYIFKVDLGWAGPLEEAAGTGLLPHDEMNRFPIEQIKVNVRTLDWLMENEIKKDHIDYLSIDVEKNEMAVLNGFTASRWKPKVIVCENIDDLNQANWFSNNGYTKVNRISFNDIYIRD